MRIAVPTTPASLRNPPVFLGHRRLSIIDISVLGHQPMTNFFGYTSGEETLFAGIRENLLRERPWRQSTDMMKTAISLLFSGILLAAGQENPRQCRGFRG